jgi:hypothetical protein
VQGPGFGFAAEVWLYRGKSAWHFITVPKAESGDIRRLFGEHAHGWGSLPVRVTVGEVSWMTSIFPEKSSGCYLLPLKASIRKSAEIKVGDKLQLYVQVLP